MTKEEFDVNDIEFAPFDEQNDYGPAVMCVDRHHSKTQGVMLSQIVRGKRKYVYEVYGCKNRWLVPFFDRERYRNSPMEVERDKWIEYEAMIKQLKEKFGDKVNIVALDASGKKGDTYIISFHAIVRGAGAYRSGKDMLRAGIIPEGFDMTVYKEENSRQLFRMIGASKAGEDRPFRYITKHEGEWKSADIWKINEKDRETIIRASLAQFSEGEQHIEVEKKEAAPVVELKQTEDGKVVALGVNGAPLGDDIVVTTQAIRELCGMAGWFLEFDRDKMTWAYEMWMLQNIADDYKLGDGLDELMMDVSNVWKGGIESVNNIMDIRKVSMNRPTDKKRKNLGALRKLVSKKDPDGYVLWMDKHKKPIPILSGPAKPDTMTFYDHNKFTGKVISHEMALKWAQDALVYVEDGGKSYFLTRDIKVCEVTNMPVEIWKHTSEDDMMRCLETVVYITNDKRTPEAIAVVEQKEKLNAKITPAERRAAAEFMYRSFGKGTKKETQFMGDVLTHRKFRVVKCEDFIPFLARRIPDADVARRVGDPTIFNSFRQFPIESLPWNPGCKYWGSQMQSHLREIICQGDEVEFRHLEGTIADLIQRPYEISGVAHVFYGGQGTGKSILGAFMRGLIGAAQVMEFNDVATFFARFNDDHATALLKIFEEVSDKSEGLINNNKLKHAVNAPLIRIEIKGAAILKLKNLARLWFISNHRNTVHIEQDDRRYTFHKSSAKYADNAEYFNPLWALVKDKEFLRSAFEYFAELPYDLDFVRKALVTKEKNEQKIEGMTLPFKFLNDFMYDEFDRLVEPNKIGDLVLSTEVYRHYKFWCAENQVAKPVRPGVLSKIFNDANIVALPERCTINGEQLTRYRMVKAEILNGYRAYYKIPTFEFLTPGSF